MSNSVNLKMRLKNKHDIPANWANATFAPMAGEIVVYDDHYFDDDGNKVVVADAVKFKIGDGVTPINDLPFVEMQPDWNQNDETAKDYIKNRPTWTSDAVTEIANGEYTSEFHESFFGIYGIIIETSAVWSRLDFTIDGENYSYKLEDCTVIDGTVCAGNLSKINPLLGTDYPDTGESFILAINGSAISIGTDFTQSTTHNIILSAVVTKVEWNSLYQDWFDDNYLSLEENNRQIAELNNEVTIATFNIVKDATKISLSNLNVSEIDWGDGVINNDLTHTYENFGSYTCKIYGCEWQIADRAFYDCDSLTSVTIPNSVTYIGYGAFEYCDSLTSVTIPDSVTFINSFAFYDSDLIDITFKNPAPITYYTDWFINCTSLSHIYVPYGCAEAYRTKWAEDGASQEILDLIVESDREAMMSDLEDFMVKGEKVSLNHGEVVSWDEATSKDLAGYAITFNEEFFRQADSCGFYNADLFTSSGGYRLYINGYEEPPSVYLYTPAGDRQIFYDYETDQVKVDSFVCPSDFGFINGFAVNHADKSSAELLAYYAVISNNKTITIGNQAMPFVEEGDKFATQSWVKNNVNVNKVIGDFTVTGNVDPSYPYTTIVHPGSLEINNNTNETKLTIEAGGVRVKPPFSNTTKYIVFPGTINDGNPDNEVFATKEWAQSQSFRADTSIDYDWNGNHTFNVDAGRITFKNYCPGGEPKLYMEISDAAGETKYSATKIEGSLSKGFTTLYFPDETGGVEGTLATQEWVNSQTLDLSDYNLEMANDHLHLTDITAVEKELHFYTPDQAYNYIKSNQSGYSLEIGQGAGPCFGAAYTFKFSSDTPDEIVGGTVATREWVQENITVPEVDTSNLVTTDTSQDILGRKHFVGGIGIGNGNTSLDSAQLFISGDDGEATFTNTSLSVAGPSGSKTVSYIDIAKATQEWLSDEAKLFTGDQSISPYSLQGTMIGDQIYIGNNSEDTFNGYMDLSSDSVYIFKGATSTCYKDGVISYYSNNSPYGAKLHNLNLPMHTNSSYEFNSTIATQEYVTAKIGDLDSDFFNSLY